jgi:Ca2+-transporting ATPase
MDEPALARALDHVAVFARVDPADKLRIVEALSARGEVVAMTGDGVNDAPALRRAPMGVAMGKTGTDVAREAADMVLLDDDFATIVAAIREGRTVFANIRKSICFLLGSNAGLVLAVAVSSCSDRMLLLTPLQLLWINLVTNGLPALALGVEPVEEHVMDRTPISPEAPLMDPPHLRGLLRAGLWMGLTALLVYDLPWLWPELMTSGPASPAAPEQARTMVFVLLALAPLFHAFNCRDLERSLASLSWSGSLALLAAVMASGLLQVVAVLIPAFHPVFHAVPLSLAQWLVVLVLAALVIPVEEAAKWAARRKRLADLPSGR